ncbi:MAG: M23 family metallopeptidase [Actinobacteria bacterium]|nr:M23 family metallopeptidase [Actinomycetota bacterium]
MRNRARLSLGIIAVLAAALVIPRPIASSAFAAAIQITPTLPDILKTPTPTLDPNDPGGGGGGNEEPGGGGGGNEKPGGGGGGNKESGIKVPSGDKKDNNKNGRQGNDGKKKNKKKNKKKEAGDLPSGVPTIPGSYNTEKLVAVAARLRSLGMSQGEVVRRVYPPFIIAGPASWIDTWGAPRYGPAPGQVRTHEGQDVFCDYGDPILAPVNGWVDFSDGGLGGITARVHDRTTGRYWYLTHLSDLNTEDFSSGDDVNVGDVVGYCGNSGNAITTPPHVHFGWYAEGGTNPKNPMRPLIRWLHEAERRVLGVVTKTTKKRVKQQPALTAARRFGDAFAPDISELRIESGSLWASGSDPATGAFTLAESALQAALSTGADSDRGEPQEADYYLGAGENLPGLFDPDSGLSELLEGTHTHSEGSD